MQIHGLHQSQATQAVARSGSASAGSPVTSSAVTNSAQADQLELSAEAQQISETQAAGAASPIGGGIRSEKVAAIRQAIADGTYETPEKLSAALDQLLDTFA
jgi:flagellar biosynthesis anti-sigma factor FlgM